MNFGFFPKNLLETLPMAGIGWVGIFVVVLVMIAVVYGISIFSVLLSRFARRRANKKNKG